MKRILTAVVTAVAMTAWASAAAAQAPARAAGPGSTPPPNGGNRGFVPVTDEMLWKPSPSNWLSWRRTLDSQGFSPLDQIDRTNVGKLKMAWARGMGNGNMESTPLVYDGVMYAPGPADYIQAINAKTGDLIWENRRKLPEGVRGGTNRNIAIWGTTIIDGSADNQMYAIDARTGALVWETKVLDATARASASSGPIIANGKVIEGRQCQPQAGNDACIVTAHDAKTGKEIWRARTIPLPGELGYETWGAVPMAERWHVGTWMVPSYDPETNTVFVGTSVTIPAPKFTLDGNDKKYLFHNSTLALDADTGKMKWYYQHVVDHWDLDHPFERLLVETAISPDPKEVPWINPKIKPGERRKVITGIPGKTGLVYTLDRQTGEFLWARPTVFQNVISKIDGATGEVTVNPDATFSKLGEEKDDLPERGRRRQKLAGGRLQPAHQRHVLSAAERLHEREDDHRQARSRRSSTVSTCRPCWRQAPTRSARSTRSRWRPAGRCGSTSSAPARCRSWRRAAGSSSAATSTGASAPSTIAAARSCGSRTSARRWSATRDVRGGRQAVRRRSRPARRSCRPQS
jgi:alcohol dehydrogenase (cytochrome c)